VELVNRTSCLANIASVTADGVLIACTFAALCFSSALVRGPAAVVSVVFVFVLYYGRISYLVHCQDVSINCLAQSPCQGAQLSAGDDKKRKGANPSVETAPAAWLDCFSHVIMSIHHRHCKKTPVAVKSKRVRRHRQSPRYKLRLWSQAVPETAEWCALSALASSFLLIWFEYANFTSTWPVLVAAYVSARLLKATFEKPPSVRALRQRALSVLFVLLVINILVLVMSFCAPHYLGSTSVENVETRFEQRGMKPVLVPPLANASSQHVLPPDIKEALLLLDCYQDFDLDNSFPHFTVIKVITACSSCAGFVMPCENIDD
jgi:hypothetical protein